jgi:endonuclease/exonuclease/phosphatase family metal-dependent hydrolase
MLGLSVSACTPAFNYVDPDGPRYFGRAPDAASPVTTHELLVVTFNIEYALRIDAALEELTAAGLGVPDILLLQEMDAPGTERMANALAMNWVYYPASVHGDRDFGIAVLSRWPIAYDEKVLLPGAAPFDGRRRIAVSATIEGPCGTFFAVSVHNEAFLAGESVQHAQALAVRDYAFERHDGLPGVVAGDFNLVGSSRWLEEAFADSGLTHVAPLPAQTTASSAFGSHALDHVFARDFLLLDARVAPSHGASDHHAVAVTLRCPEAP